MIFVFCICTIGDGTSGVEGKIAVFGVIKQRADYHTEVIVALWAEIPQRTRVNSPSAIFISVYQTHSADLWRTGHRSGWECIGNGICYAHPFTDLASDRGNQLVYLFKTVYL